MKRVLFFLLMPALAMFAYSCDSDSEGSGDWPEPHISGIVTDYGGKVVSGKPVTINGYNFSPVASENKVLYGIGLDAVSMRVTEASETQIVFIAPKTDNAQLKIRVSVKGKESNQVTLLFDNSLAESQEEDTPVDLSAMLNASKKTIIRPGVEWISFHGVWEGQVRNINIVKTQLNEHNRLGIYYQYGAEDDYVSTKCEYLDALVGTNGPMACCHFVRVDGVIKRSAPETKPEEYFVYNCALTIDDNVPDIVKVRDNYGAAALKNKNVGCAGPLLVYEDKIQTYPEDATAAFLKTTHPRTAFGITKDQKTVIQVAVDGRWTDSDMNKRAIGMETPLLAKLMKGLGCYKALNFDGGGGTAMWIYGQGVNGIVNHPCDSPKNWDNPTLRTSGNAIYIYSDLK